MRQVRGVREYPFGEYPVPWCVKSAGYRGGIHGVPWCAKSAEYRGGLR